MATDRSFVVALSRGLDVLRAFHPNDGLLGNQEIAARTNLPKPTISRLTYTLTKLGYLTPVPRFEKYQLAPSAMALGYAALANLGVRHLSEPYREEVIRATGGAVAVIFVTGPLQDEGKNKVPPLVNDGPESPAGIPVILADSGVQGAVADHPDHVGAPQFQPAVTG